MMILFKADDGSLFEIEEIAPSSMRCRFQDGLTRAVAETVVPLKDYANIAHIIFDCQQIAEAFRMGTPKSSATNQRLISADKRS